MATIQVQGFTYKVIVDGDTILVSTYGDGVFIREDEYQIPGYSIDSAVAKSKSNAENFGVLGAANSNLYEKSPTPPPPAVLPPTALPKEQKKKYVKYQPKTKYEKSKSTPGGEFTVKATGADYKGVYFGGYKGLYYAGDSPLAKGVELTKTKTQLPGAVATVAVGLLLLALRSFFAPKLKQSDLNKGTLTRYFSKAPGNPTISEISKDDYKQLKLLVPNRIYAQMDWQIQGPAKDQDINGYKYEGAESKNKKAIQVLEKQIPGISNFITDYGYLVQEAKNPMQSQVSTQSQYQQDPDTKLDNDRKANFDLRL